MNNLLTILVINCGMPYLSYANALLVNTINVNISYKAIQATKCPIGKKFNGSVVGQTVSIECFANRLWSILPQNCVCMFDAMIYF